MTDATTLNVGDRVSAGKDFGTVQYVPRSGRIVWLYRESDGRLIGVRPPEVTPC